MPERDLYPAVERFLNIQFAPTLKPKLGTHLPLVAETSQAGATGAGVWSRPDLALVNIWRQKYHPTQNLDLYGFEVKKNDACDVSSVYETLAHSRMVNFAYLVWNYGGEITSARFQKIAKSCQDLGLGLISFSDQNNGDTFNIHLAAKRASPSEDAVAEFIETRFEEDQRDRLMRWIREGR
jgi:hypothetical protein